MNELISKTQVRLLEFEGNPSQDYKDGYCQAIHDVLNLEPIIENKIVNDIDFAIKATNIQDEYSRGMRNGMRYAKSLIDGKDLVFEEFLEDLNG